MSEGPQGPIEDRRPGRGQGGGAAAAVALTIMVGAVLLIAWLAV